MLVLQDFEVLTPNLLARTIETVEGGGMVCILLKTMTSLKQLYTMTMVVNHMVETNSRTYTRDIEQMLMMTLFPASMSAFYYLWGHARHVL